MRLTANINVLSRELIGAAIEVHRELGPTLLESTYSRCLQRELTDRKLHFERERTVPLVYKGEDLHASYRIDLVVEGLIVVELKSVEHVLPVHKYQVLTYLRVSDYPLGLLMNFNVAKLTDGITRLVNPRRRAYLGDAINLRE